MKLYQDAAGTIPATQPGHPVGLVVSQAGRINHSQSTTLSKPTLARWPRFGVRNVNTLTTFGALSVGRTNTYDANGLQVTLSRDGIIGTIVNKGEINGIQFIDVNYSGTNTGSSSAFLNLAPNNVTDATEGDDYTVSMYLALLDGVAPPSLRLFLNFNPAPTQSITAVPALNSEFKRYSLTGKVGAGKNVTAGRGAYIDLAPGDSVNCTLRFGGGQLEKGTQATPLQIASGPNDITEPGVPDLWHLYNDGGDSLNAVYPAGTYGVGYLSTDLVPTFTTVVSDEVTGISSLLTERQVDVVIRPGEFTQADKDKIIESWGRI